MKKRFCLALTLLVITALAGCSGFRQSTDQGEKNEKTVVKKENTVVWAVRENTRVSKENIQKTNELLAKKGYDLAIKVKKLKTDRTYEKQEIYHLSLIHI